MKLEDQVASLELCKRLKELGVKQESEFYWNCDTDHWTSEPCKDTRHWRLINDDGNEREGYSAFTVAELGEMLPKEVRSGALWWLEIVRSEAWRFKYGKIIFTAGTGDTEADARAKMLIHLIEKGIVMP